MQKRSSLLNSFTHIWTWSIDQWPSCRSEVLSSVEEWIHTTRTSTSGPCALHAESDKPSVAQRGYGPRTTWCRTLAEKPHVINLISWLNIQQIFHIEMQPAQSQSILGAVNVHGHTQGAPCTQVHAISHGCDAGHWYSTPGGHVGARQPQYFTSV